MYGFEDEISCVKFSFLNHCKHPVARLISLDSDVRVRLGFKVGQLTMDKPLPLYWYTVLASSFDAALTVILFLFASSCSRHCIQLISLRIDFLSRKSSCNRVGIYTPACNSLAMNKACKAELSVPELKSFMQVKKLVTQAIRRCAGSLACIESYLGMDVK